MLDRARVAQDVKSLDQDARGTLRKLGVRSRTQAVIEARTLALPPP